MARAKGFGYAFAMSLTSTDIDRHKRHLLLKEIGGPGVQKLTSASVSIVGAGALGGPCAMYLAAAGIGKIEIVDDDVVDRSNLQRQVQFTEADIGRKKAETLAARLLAQNQSTVVLPRVARFQPGDALLGDVVIDATDNFETRFALNALAHLTERPLVSGAAARWNGQVSVFASGVRVGTPCYQCWVPALPPEPEACDTIGVVGPVTGLVGTRMALETIKWIVGTNSLLIERLWLVDGLSGETRTVKLTRDPACPVCAS
ncbi:MAG: HesA/MoeB/ThiF family protein [Pseudomonadota bacterium]